MTCSVGMFSSSALDFVAPFLRVARRSVQLGMSVFWAIGGTKVIMFQSMEKVVSSAVLRTLELEPALGREHAQSRVLAAAQAAGLLNSSSSDISSRTSAIS